MKVIFLIGNAKSVLDFWSGKTKKGKRSLVTSKIKLNSSDVFEGKIMEQKGKKRDFSFLFVVLEKKKANKIPELLQKLEITSKESAVVITDKERCIIKDMGIEKISGKRYHSVGPCNFLIFLKGTVQNKDVNEMASVLFLNYGDEMSKKDGRLRKIL